MKADFTLSWIIGVMLLCLSCQPEQQAVSLPSYVPEGYQLAFEDDFDTFELDTAGDGSAAWAPWWVGWGVRHLEGNKDKAWKCDATYTGDGDVPLGITLHELSGNSSLRLYGLETPPDKRAIVSDFPFIAGMISGRDHYAQTYGYFEVRARVEVSQGHHWALWLLPTDDSWPPEIDMAEIVGHQANQVHMNAHGVEGGTPMISTVVESTSEYHVFGFLWTPTEMVWTLDGEERKRIPNYIDQPMYLLLSPEIGGQWTGLPDETTVWPMVAEVDYVRTYQRP